MAPDIIRDAPLGQLLRYLTGNRILRYPEEMPDFKAPIWYTPDAPFPDPEKPQSLSGDDQSQVSVPVPDNDDNRPVDKHVPFDELGRAGSNVLRPHSRADEVRLEQKDHDLEALERGTSYPVRPHRRDDGTVMVDWYTTDDPDNPQNWSFGKKFYSSLVICLYTCAVYMGSSIFASGATGMIAHFGVSEQMAYLGLSMYVTAYGIGPMIWAPMSEIPFFGRNIPYVVTFTIFFLLTIPATLANNFNGIIATRFLLGFFGSPCLANGGASFVDMFSFHYVSVALPSWAFWACVGPSLGPVIGGFAVSAMGWRWASWIIMWFSGPMLILMWTTLPETSADNILMRRAKRLRLATGNNKLKSESEVKQASLSPRAVVVEALWRPIQIILLDPSVAFTAGYIALVYGIFYSFFEAFPVVYGGIYRMSLSQLGLTFLSTSAGVIIAISIYLTYMLIKVVPHIIKHGMFAPETWLRPALVATWVAPVGLFLFGWTARASIHWIVSLVGVTIFVGGVFILFQCVFMYLAASYPKYTASLFAGNDFARSLLAAGAIHFSTPLFRNLGVGPAASLLGAFTLVCVAGIYVLHHYGAALRAKSRFAD